jgi:hypothetical protein
MQNGGKKDNFMVLTCNYPNARMESLQNCIKCKPFTIWWCLIVINEVNRCVIKFSFI